MSDYLILQSESVVDCSAAFSVLESLAEWEIEWNERNETPMLPAASDAGYYLRVSAGGFGLRVYKRADGLTEIEYGTFGAAETAMTVSVLPRATIKIESKYTGHKVYIDGVQASPVYSAGSASDYLPFAPPLIAFEVVNYTGIISGITVTDTANTVLYYALTDGAGDVGHESISGRNAALSGHSWGYDSQDEKIIVSPFEGVGIDRILQPPSNALMCPFVYADTGNPAFFSGGDWSALAKSNVARNPDCWVNARAVSCVSAWSDDTVNRFPATLISPRHVLINSHVSTPIGTEYLFLDANNNAQSTTLIDTEAVSGDAVVGILADDITLDVEFARFLPSGFVNYTDAEGFDACGMSREGWFDVSTTKEIAKSGMSRYIVFDRWYNYSRFSIDKTSRIGDSQRPMFIRSGSELFLLFTTTTFNASGYSLSGTEINDDAVKAEIKSAMDTLDTDNARTPNYDLVIGQI